MRDISTCFPKEFWWSDSSGLSGMILGKLTGSVLERLNSGTQHDAKACEKMSATEDE